MSSVDIPSSPSTLIRTGLTNATFLTVINVFISFIQFLSQIYVVRVLGPSDYGIWITVGAFNALFGFFGIGGYNKVMIREGSKDIENMSRVLNNTIGIRQIGCLFGILFCNIFVYISNYSDLTKMLVSVWSLSLLFGGMTSFPDAVFRAHEKFILNGKLNLGLKIIYVTLTLSSLYLGFGIEGYVVSATFIMFLGFIVKYLFAIRYTKFKILAKPVFEKDLFKQALVFSLNSKIRYFILGADLLMLSIMGTLEEVGIYGVGSRLALIFLMLRGSIGETFLPPTIKYLSKNTINIKSLINPAIIFVSLGLIGTWVFSLFAEDMMIFLYGPELAPSSEVFVIMLLYVTLNYSYVGHSTILQATHNEFIITKILLVAGIINLTSNYILYDKFGYIGIAYASILVSIFLTLSFFTYGTYVLRRQNIVSFRSIKEKYNSADREILKSAFKTPIREQETYYEPITAINEIYESNQRLLIFRDGFETAYDDLELIGAEQVTRPVGMQPVVKVRFQYQDHEHEAFAYGMLPSIDNKSRRASLIIPGSGTGGGDICQSYAIAADVPDNYQYGIHSTLNQEGEVYVFIKPNNDFLAWHDGKGKKLDNHFIWNWHLNHGGSYSVSYLVQSLAVMKWIKSCYRKTIVAGLSQGGTATLINSLQSKPDCAIVCSGYTILNNKFERTGPNHIVGVPGCTSLYDAKFIKNKLHKSPTSWFFSWGKNEIGVSRIEAEEGLTSEALKGLSNVEISIHDRGHIFPIEEIHSFLE
tara:strand:- start:889 stop:3156 length:2268 start_codon:yes stop_codon:yes gene_type:complete